MSKAFIDHNQQQNSNDNQSETLQKKIDPVAQLKWINSQQVDQGWGIPTQMFASDENLPAGAQAKEGMSINSDTALEKEADVMGEKAAQGKMADVAGKGSGVQMQKSEGDPPGKAIKTYTPNVDYETLKKKMEVIAAESNRIYYAILTDIVDMLNSEELFSYNPIKKGTEEYNVVWQEIYKNVKLQISVMPYQVSPMLNAAPEYKVSDVNIIYKNISLKEYRRQKLLDVGKEVGPIAYSWGSKLFKVIRGKGPGMFPNLLGKTASTVLGTGFLFLGFMLKSTEAGRGSSLSEQRKARLDMYRNATNKALEIYMPALFEAITN